MTRENRMWMRRRSPLGGNTAAHALVAGRPAAWKSPLGRCRGRTYFDSAPFTARHEPPRARSSREERAAACSPLQEPRRHRRQRRLRRRVVGVRAAGRGARPGGETAPFFHRRPTVDVPSSTGQAFKHSTCHWPLRETTLPSVTSPRRGVERRDASTRRARERVLHDRDDDRDERLARGERRHDT